MKRVSAFLSLCLLACCIAAFAQVPTLKDVTAGQTNPGSTTNWWMWAAIIIAVGSVVFFLWLKKKDPAEALKVSNDFNTAILALLVEFKKIAASIEGKVAGIVPTTAAIIPAAPVPEVVVGKFGVPGEMKLQVTGDPITDTATFNSQYFPKKEG